MLILQYSSFMLLLVLLSKSLYCFTDTQKEELRNSNKIDPEHPLFVSDKDGHIQSPFVFDPEKWVFTIEVSTEDKNFQGCVFSLDYLSDSSQVLVRPQYQHKPVIMKGDYIFYLQKGPNRCGYETVSFESLYYKVTREDCLPGVYKGANQIKPIVSKLKENANLEAGFTDSFRFISFLFSEVEFDNFDLRRFRKIISYSNTPDQKQIVSFLTKTKTQGLASISNYIFVSHLKENVIDQYQELQKEIDTFCEGFEMVNGKYKKFCNTTETHLFQRLVDFFKSLFGFGATEIDQQVSSFCQEKKIGFTEDDLVNLFSGLLVSSDDPELHDSLKEIRNGRIQAITEIYEKAKVNPLLVFFKIKKTSLQMTRKTKLDSILNTLHANELKSVSSDLLSIPKLKQKTEYSLDQLQRLKAQFLQIKSKLSESLSSNEVKVETTKENKQKHFLKLLKMITRFLESLKEKIESTPTHFAEDFITDLKKFFEIKFNKEIFKIISKSELNQTIGFLDKDRNINLSILNNFLVNIGFIDSFYDNQINLVFSYLDFEKYKRSNGVMII